MLSRGKRGSESTGGTARAMQSNGRAGMGPQGIGGGRDLRRGIAVAAPWPRHARDPRRGRGGAGPAFTGDPAVMRRVIASARRVGLHH